MGEVVELGTITRLDIPVEKVLRGATEEGLEAAVVIGWDAKGEFYFASSYAGGPDVLWLLELAKRALLATAED